MANFQSIQTVTQVAEVEMTYMELRANWECAAIHARKEGVFGVHERLFTDIEEMDKHFKRDDVLVIRKK